MNRVVNGMLALVILLMGIGIGLTVRLPSGVVAAQGGCQTFPETSKAVCGRFPNTGSRTGVSLNRAFR